MIRELFIAACSLFVATAAIGQKCNAIRDDAERLRCFDKMFPREAAEAQAAAPALPVSGPTVAPPPVVAPFALPDFLRNFKLANEATPAGALRTDPAGFSYAKLNGEEYSVVQAALVWEPGESWFPADSYLSTYGWGPYASYSINRNSLSTKRADVRQGAIGLYGTLFSIKGQKEPGTLIAPISLATLTKLELGYRENKVNGTKSIIYTADNWLVSRWLYDGIPYLDKFAWFVSPRIGLQIEDRRSVKAGNPLGQTRSAFAQLKAEFYPGVVSDRMKLTLLAQRYIDLSASSGIAERAETFSKAGVEFLLYPPRAQNTVQPSIALERSYGADLLTGLPKQGLTQVVFKLKVN